MISIQDYKPKYRNQVIDICWKTGYMGDDAKPHFPDRYLFGLLFCLYYTDYEPENCFVAIDTNSDKAVGYILSSLDSEIQEENFNKKIIPKIIFRMFSYSIWRYNQSFRIVWGWRKLQDDSALDKKTILSKYPSHLHIDVLDEYQRQGIGASLINNLENHLKVNGSKGVHLGTSSYNSKALPFYEKMGFELVYQGSEGSGMWPSARQARSIIYAKEI